MTEPMILDEAFRREMAERNPRNAFSCLSTAPVRPPMSDREWLADANLSVNDAVGVHVAFVDQVGPRWSGLAGIAPARRTAFVLLAAALAGEDVGQALADVGQAALAGLSDDEILAVATSHGLVASAREVVEEAAAAHAFETTAFWEVVSRTKDRPAPFSSSEYMWLAARDRTAWLSLVSCGRGKHFVEVAAIWLHHRCEARMGRPLDEVWTKPLLDGLARSFAAAA